MERARSTARARRLVNTPRVAATPDKRKTGATEVWIRCAMSMDWSKLCRLNAVQPRYHATAMRPVSRHTDDRLLLETCHDRSGELLRQNLSPGGILAATIGQRAQLRGYTAIFGRDAAVCALGMAVS